MRHIRMLGLCLVAAFALGAIASASASAAEPEWGVCVAKKKGLYADSNCQTEDVKKGKPKGSYEWLAGAESHCYATKKGRYSDAGCTTEDVKKGKPKGAYEKTAEPTFKGAGGASVLVSNATLCIGGNQIVNELCNEPGGFDPNYPGVSYVDQTGISEIECTSESAEGELSGTKEATHVHVVFHGCHYAVQKCYNKFKDEPTDSEPIEGEIAVNTLKGELGYISESAHTVGIVLHPAAGGPFVEFECNHGALFVSVGAGPNTWTNNFGTETEEPWYTGSGGDGIISPIEPVNKMSLKYTQKYTVTKPTEEPEAGAPTVVPQNQPSHFEVGGNPGPTELLENWIGSSETTPMEVEEAGYAGRFAWSPAGEVVENVNTGAGEVEIKG